VLVVVVVLALVLVVSGRGAGGGGGLCENTTVKQQPAGKSWQIGLSNATTSIGCCLMPR